MTNLEKIQQMDIDEFTDWFTHQLWPNLHKDEYNGGYVVRWHAVRNFLLDTWENDNG